MISVSAVGWTIVAITLSALVLQEFRRRRQCQSLQLQIQDERDLSTATITRVRIEADTIREEIETLAVTLQASSEAVAKLSATNESLATDLNKQVGIIALKNEELTGNAVLIAQLEMKVADDEARRVALSKPKPVAPRPRSPFEIGFTDDRMLTKLLPEALRYCRETVAHRLALSAPDNTDVHLVNEPAGDVITCVVTRQEGSLVNDARRWFSGVNPEQQHLVSLHDEARLFAVKIHLVTGHLEHLNVSDCAGIARDFVHLLTTGGASMLRILSNMSMSIKLEGLGQKSDHIILLLNAAQIGRLNGIFLGAGEEYRRDTISQDRIMPLRQELLELECELLAELRCRLVTAPDVQAFQIKWGQMRRSSREAFYNNHFLGAVGKIRLAIEAFLIDLILAQDTDSRDHFFAYTVAQQATELGKITKILAAQLGVIKDEDGVDDARALYSVCMQFQILLEHLSAPPPGGDLAAAA